MSNDRSSSAANDARELDRLVRFMTRKGRRFGLALATYADEQIAAAQRERANERASSSGVRVSTIRLMDLGEDLIAELAEISGASDVVHVIGLDGIAFDRTGQGLVTLALTNLNVRRDELPSHVDARVVFWIAAEAHPQLAKLAWDLLDVMLTRFEFHGERRADIRPTHRPTLRIETAYNPEHVEQGADWQAREATRSTDPTTRADSSAAAGDMYAQIGRLDRAIEHLDRAASIYERNTNENLYSIVLAVAARRGLAKALWRDRQWGRARDELERALQIADAALADDDEPTASTREVLEAQRLECLWTQQVFEPSEDSAPCDDFELLDRWQHGDGQAVRRLFVRQLPTVARFLERIVPSSADESQVVDTFMQLWHLPESYPAIDFRATLFEAARIVVKDSRPPAPPLAVRPRDPALQATLERLHLDARELIEMHYVFGVPTDELAEMFGVVEPTLQFRLQAAVRRLLDEHAQQTGVQLLEPDLRAAFGRSVTET